MELKDTNILTCKVLFKKVAKGLNKKDFVISQYKLRIEQLEARVQQLELRKRRKVKTSLNSKFTGIKAIKKAQIKVRDREIILEDSDSFISLASTLSCIEIED